MPFSFNTIYPEALWLLLLLPVVILMARRGGSGVVLRKSARRLSIALRLSIVTLLVLSIANLQLVTSSNKMATVFLLDYSDSVGADGRAQELDFARKAIANMQDDQQAGIVVFGQEALVERLVSPDKKIGNIVSAPNQGYTNLAEAVRLGTALLPDNAQRRLVLLTDGNQNLDDVRNATTIASAKGVQIDVVALQQTSGPEVSVGNLQVAGSLRKGEEFEVRVAVDSNYSGPGQLQILQDGQIISDKPVDLKPGSNLFKETLTAKTEGPVNYTARVVAPGDTLSQNNEMQTTSVVKNGPKILLVEGHPEQKEAANLQAALTQTGIDSTTIAPDRFPASTELSQYDSVVLVNVPGSSLNASSMKLLQTYVKDLGKGLVTVGGEDSYGVGGWFRTPLEEMLPVELQLPSRKEIPSVAMVLVIDRSGSMASTYYKPGVPGPVRSKLEIAKDAAALAVTQLSSTDQVGIVVFDQMARWQVPLGPVGDTSTLQNAISRITLGGGTSIYSGFAPAVEALKTATAKNKHILILTDGQDRDRLTKYDDLLEEANKSNITVSTVGLGDDVNSAFLGSLADRGGGRYSYVDDPNNLPKIFAKEARLAARSYIVEEAFTPATADSSPIIKRITSTPELKGYVATRIKKNATLALVTKRNEPLLAHWQYGLGRVAAWTSDAKGRWATDWLTWPDFPRFWSQLVRWTVPENKSEGLQVQTSVVGNRVRVTADALSLDSQFLNGLDVKAKVTSGGSTPQNEEVNLTQTAPGHYEGYFTPRQDGSYLVNVQGTGQPGQVLNGTTKISPTEPLKLVQTIGGASAYSPEYRQLGTNDLLLKDIASLTNGRFLTAPEQTFQGGKASSTQQHTLWPWLVLLAVLLLPIDIAARTLRLSPNALRQSFHNYRAERQRIALAQVAATTSEAAVDPGLPLDTPPHEAMPSTSTSSISNFEPVSIQELLDEIPPPPTDPPSHSPPDTNIKL